MCWVTPVHPGRGYVLLVSSWLLSLKISLKKAGVTDMAWIRIACQEHVYLYSHFLYRRTGWMGGSRNALLCKSRSFELFCT
jgi:hypothetical protein